MLLVSLRRGADREGVIQAIEGAGHALIPFGALKRVLKVDCAPGDFNVDHPDIRAVEDGDTKVSPGDSFDTNGGLDIGPWGKARHTARERPWGEGLKMPFTINFPDCVRTGDGVDLYIVDSGVRTTHTEFSGRAVSLDGFTPVNAHGTHCASIAAGNTLGLAKDASIFAAAGLRDVDGTGSSTQLISAIDDCLNHFLNTRAAEERPAVMNLSIVSEASFIFTGLEDCIDANMVVVTVSGNARENLDSEDYNNYPAESGFGIIVVGGSNMDDRTYKTQTAGTNYGNIVDILGASQHIRGAGIENDLDYRSGSGTSYGAPNVCGVLMCALQGYKRPNDLPPGAAQMAMRAYLNQHSTYGQFRNDPDFSPLPNKIAYVDPGEGPYPMLFNYITTTSGGDGDGGIVSAEYTEPHRYWRISIKEESEREPMMAQLRLAPFAEGPDYGQYARGYPEEQNLDGPFFFNMQDYNPDTAWENGRSSPVWPVRLNFDFGSAVSQIAEVVIQAKWFDGENAPGHFDVQYSDDGVNFTTWWSASDSVEFVDGETRVFTHPNPPANPYANGVHVDHARVSVVTAPNHSRYMSVDHAQIHVVISE